MASTQSVQFKNISATPASNFTLLGGTYAIQVNAATFGTVTLNALSIDGVTLLPVLPAFTANGSIIGEFGPGTYQLTIAGATGVFASITTLPS